MSSLILSAISLTQLPHDLLLHTMRLFLDASEIFALGRCDSQLLVLTQRCDLPHTCLITLDALVRERWESNAMYDALTQEDRMLLPIEYRGRITRPPGDNRRKRLRLQREIASKTERRTVESKYQIGRITAIHLSNNKKMKEKRKRQAISILQPHPPLLAQSIRSLTISISININNTTNATTATTLTTRSEFRLPPCLTELLLDGEYKDKLEGLILPSGLRILKLLSNHFQHSLENMRLPSSLTILHFGTVLYNGSISGIQLPESLTELNVRGQFAKGPCLLMPLPHGLRSLHISGRIHHPIIEDMNALPSTLTELSLGYHFKHTLMHEWRPPSSLTRLVIPSTVRLSGDLIELPRSELIFELPPPLPIMKTNNTVELITFRNHLTSVEFTTRNDMRLSDALFPPSVHTINLGIFGDAIDYSWQPPINLRHFITGSMWDHSLNQLQLSDCDTIRTLTIDYSYFTSLKDVIWPNQLECLIIDTPPRRLPIIGVPQNLPTTMKRIVLTCVLQDEVPQDWLDASLPEGCAFYDSVGKKIARVRKKTFEHTTVRKSTSSHQ